MKKKAKAIEELKKNRAGLTMCIFVLVSLAALSVMGMFVMFMAQYIFESKLKAEYDTIAYMAKIYDSTAEDTQGTSEILNAEGRDYIIRDKDGGSIYENGKNTCGDAIQKIRLFSGGHSIKIYTDKEAGFISSDEEGNPIFDLAGFIRKLKDKESYEQPNDKNAIFFVPEIIDDDEAALGLQRLRSKYGRMIRLPVWMAVDVRGGAEEFIGKAYFSAGAFEIMLLVTFCLIIVFFALIIFAVVLVSVLKGHSNQKRTMRVFFTDQVTGGHNWMWFLYKGEHLLKKRANAKNEYAIVNLVFVKYRNYVVCHSVEAGERVLSRVYETIEKHLQKNELCAHCTLSNFALLMDGNNRELLKKRLEVMIKELETVDSDHVFSFQAGVDIIDVNRGKNGKFVKRKDTDIELEYNNACAARMTIEGNDASGIAVFDVKMVEDKKWEDTVSEHQRSALEKEEFVVYYQPKYDPGTQKLKGAEALIRWQSPEFGLVPPGKFIPIFEKNGFITEIDHYMIKHVAKDQKRWLDEGKSCVPVSVNVSRAHFIESDLADQIRDMVDNAGAPRELIEIELTESAFFDDKNALIATIMKLKEYGFEISMDDFGSGYSSLNSLKDMPLDVLKLDAEFFRGDDADTDRSRIVVSETIRLAKSLHMRTVAEGVEIKEQVDFLAEQGCDMIQGYYFSKPLPKQDFEKKMAAG